MGAIGFIQEKVPSKTEIIAAEIYDFSQFNFINWIKRSKINSIRLLICDVEFDDVGFGDVGFDDEEFGDVDYGDVWAKLKSLKYFLELWSSFPAVLL